MVRFRPLFKKGVLKEANYSQFIFSGKNDKSLVVKCKKDGKVVAIPYIFSKVWT